MTDLEYGELRVVVPVGFLLDEEQEVTVSVDRPDGTPLPIRLRLVPACSASAEPDQVVDDHTPMPVGWPSRRRLARFRADDDGYPGHDMGGGD
jgi:hypothetical protein